jgi:uncharacterized protein YhhL (DUF1145 family)
MTQEYNEYNDLIKQMKAMPQVNPPSDITKKVMGRLSNEHRLHIGQMLRQTVKQASATSLSRFANADSRARDTSFNFLIAGFFFFFIGAVLFSSIFFIAYESKITGFILLQSILVLMAAISLMIGGVVMTSDSNSSAYWAKWTILIYGILMTASVALIASVVRTTLGGLWVMIFAMGVIVTGMTLLRALSNRAQDIATTLRGELHNV